MKNHKHKIKWKKITSLLTVMSFTFSLVSGYMPDPCAADNAAQAGIAASVEYAALDADTFTMPRRLGEVKYFFKGTSGRTVIHIQDAHCNYFAQNKLSEILRHLKSEYGLDAVNLEGGAGEYDTAFLASTEDARVRSAVADYFVSWGELNGAEAFAIRTPGEVSLWGVEDDALYLKNLKVYRDSVLYMPEVEKYLGQLSSALDALKGRIYSPELLELDRNYSDYKAGKMEFRDYIVYLIDSASAADIGIDKFRNVELLRKSLEKEGLIDFKKANSERDTLVDKLKKVLSKKELEELAAKILALKNEDISRNELYDFLLRKAGQMKMDMSAFPELAKYVEYVSFYHAVDRMALVAEMGELEDAIKGKLFTSNAQRELNILSRNLVIMKNLFAIALTKNDYSYYTSNENSFAAGNYVKFIGKEAPASGISVKIDKDISKLDVYRQEISGFYGYSFERDVAFLKNMKFSPSGTAVLVTGGFHAENLCELMKNAGISYVSIMPSFRSEEGYECPYFQILAGGGMSPVEQAISTAISAMQVPSLLNKLGLEASSESRVELFRRAGELIRKLLETKSTQAIRAAEGTFLVLSFNAEGEASWSAAENLPEGVAAVDLSGLLAAPAAEKAASPEAAAREASVPAMRAPDAEDTTILPGSKKSIELTKEIEAFRAKEKKNEEFAKASTGVFYGIAAMAVSLGLPLLGAGLSGSLGYIALAGFAASYMVVRAYHLRKSVTGVGFFEPAAVSDETLGYDGHERNLREKYDVTTARILAAHETAHNYVEKLLPLKGLGFLREAIVLTVEIFAAIYIVTNRAIEERYLDNSKRSSLKVGGAVFPASALDMLAKPATDENADAFVIELVRKQLVPAAVSPKFYGDVINLRKLLEALSVYKNLPQGFKDRVNVRINQFAGVVLAMSGDNINIDEKAKSRILRALSKGLGGKPADAFNRITGLSNISSEIPSAGNTDLMEAFLVETASGGFSAFFADKGRVRRVLNMDYGDENIVQVLSSAARYYNEVKVQIRDKEGFFEWIDASLEGTELVMARTGIKTVTAAGNDAAAKKFSRRLDKYPFLNVAATLDLGGVAAKTSDGIEVAVSGKDTVTIAGKELEVRGRKVQIRAVQQLQDYRGKFAVDMFSADDRKEIGEGDVKAVAGTDIFGRPSIVLLCSGEVRTDSGALIEALGLAVDSILSSERGRLSNKVALVQRRRLLEERSGRIKQSIYEEKMESADLIENILRDPEMLFGEKHAGIDVQTGQPREYDGEELLKGLLSGMSKSVLNARPDKIDGESVADTERRDEEMNKRKLEYLKMLRNIIFGEDSQTLGEQGRSSGGVTIGVPFAFRMPSGAAYKTGDLLADGGFGSVFEVTVLNEDGTPKRDENNKEIKKALKLLRASESDLSSHPENAWQFADFMKEYLLAHALRGEEWSVGADGAGSYTASNGKRYYYFVMDKVEKSSPFDTAGSGSPNLHNLIHQHRLTESEILDIARQMISIVLELHKRGIVDRDFKPGNIMVETTTDADGKRKFTLKKIDYGLALLTPGIFSDEKATVRSFDGGFIFGTPGYMPPEALQDSRQERTDLYALGCSLYELLTGQMVSPGGTADIAIKKQDIDAAIVQLASRRTIDKQREHLERLTAELIRHENTRISRALMLSEISHELASGQFEISVLQGKPDAPGRRVHVLRQVRQARADTGFYAGLAGAALLLVLPFFGYVDAAGFSGMLSVAFMAWFSGYMLARAAWLASKVGFRNEAANEKDTYETLRTRYDSTTATFLAAHEWIHRNVSMYFSAPFALIPFVGPPLARAADEAVTLLLEGAVAPLLLAKNVIFDRLGEITYLRSLAEDKRTPILKDSKGRPDSAQAEEVYAMTQRPLGFWGMNFAKDFVRYLTKNYARSGISMARIVWHFKVITFELPHALEIQKRLETFASFFDALKEKTGISAEGIVRIMNACSRGSDELGFWEALSNDEVKRLLTVLSNRGVSGDAAAAIIENFFERFLSVQTAMRSGTGDEIGYSSVRGFADLVDALGRLSADGRLSPETQEVLSRVAAHDLSLVFDAADIEGSPVRLSVFEARKGSSPAELKNRNMTESEAAAILVKMIDYTGDFIKEANKRAMDRSRDKVDDNVVVAVSRKAQAYGMVRDEMHRFIYAALSPDGYEVIRGSGISYAGGFSDKSGKENGIRGASDGMFKGKVVTATPSQVDFGQLETEHNGTVYGVIKDGMGRYQLVVRGNAGDAPVEVEGKPVYVNLNYDLYDQRAEVAKNEGGRSIARKDGMLDLGAQARSNVPLDVFVGKNIRDEYVITLLDTQGMRPGVDSAGLKNAFQSGIGKMLSFEKKVVRERVAGINREKETDEAAKKVSVSVPGPKWLWSFSGERRGIVSRAREAVQRLLGESPRKDKITYHNEMHFNELFQFLDAVFQELPVQNRESAKALTSMAIYFHDVGYFMGDTADPIAKDHEDKSIESLKDLYGKGKLSVSEAELSAIIYMINRTKMRLNMGAVKLDEEVADDQKAYEILARWNGLVPGKKADLAEMRWVNEYATRGLTFGIANAAKASRILADADARRVFMDAILCGKAMAVADIYGHSANYPFLVAYLQGEFAMDKSPAAKLTAFEQVAGSPGFFGFAEGARLKYYLDAPLAPGVDVRGITLRDVLKNPQGKVNAINKSKENNVSTMKKIDQAIKALKAGDSSGRVVLEEFIEQGMRSRVFDEEMKKQLMKEIAGFEKEASVAAVAAARAGVSLIGNVKGTDGKTITGGFRASLAGGKMLRLEHDKLAAPVEVTISKDEKGKTVAVSPEQIFGVLKAALIDPATGEYKTVNTLTPEEKKTVSALISAVSSVDRIIGIEDGPVMGYFHFDAAAGTSVLYVNKTLLSNPLAILHEIGEGFAAVPEAYKGMMTNHTYMRGAGKDVRMAYLAAAREKGTKAIDAMSVDEFTGAIAEKMRAMGLREMTPSEKALIKYNDASGKSKKASGKQALLFGLQDSIDPNGNLALTLNIKNIASGFSRGNLNIVLVRNSNIETAQAQEDVGRKAGRAFTKNEINTQVMHFDSDIADKLDKAYKLAQKNGDKLPKIFVDCMTPEDKAAVEEFLKRTPEAEGIVVIGNDDLQGVPVGDIKVNEGMVVAVAVSLLNDKRMRIDLKYSPEDMAGARRALLSMLQWSGALDETIDVTGMSATALDALMTEIFKGAIALRITKINWNEIQDWNAAQNEVLKSL